MRFCWKKKPTNSIVFSQGARIGIYCFGLNSKIWKLVNTRGVVKQSGRDGSVLNRSPQWSFYANPNLVRRVTLKTRMFSRSYTLKMLCQMCLKVTRPVLRISRSFEGHCALTNADEANKVQQNVVTAKKGKKRGIKAILRRSR